MRMKVGGYYLIKYGGYHKAIVRFIDFDGTYYKMYFIKDIILPDHADWTGRDTWIQPTEIIKKIEEHELAITLLEES